LIKVPTQEGIALYVFLAIDEMEVGAGELPDYLSKLVHPFVLEVRLHAGPVWIVD
jgi:hypothetical protein